MTTCIWCVCSWMCSTRHPHQTSKHQRYHISEVPHYPLIKYQKASWFVEPDQRTLWHHLCCHQRPTLSSAPHRNAQKPVPVSLFYSIFFLKYTHRLRLMVADFPAGYHWITGYCHPDLQKHRFISVGWPKTCLNSRHYHYKMRNPHFQNLISSLIKRRLGLV